MYNPRQYAIDLDFTTFNKEKRSRSIFFCIHKTMRHSVGVNLNMFAIVSNG